MGNSQEIRIISLERRVIRKTTEQNGRRYTRGQMVQQEWREGRKVRVGENQPNEVCMKTPR